MRPEGLPRTAALAAAIVVWALPGFAHAQDRLEYSVKANYLVRFAAFVDWPPQAFGGAGAPIAVCVLGRDAFGPLLDRAAAGRLAHGRPIVVRRPTSAAAAGACHILYLGEGGEAGLASAGAPPFALVVTDAAVSRRRGALHFVLDDGRVRFHIDRQASSRAGLTISSRLLALALTVRQG